MALSEQIPDDRAPGSSSAPMADQATESEPGRWEEPVPDVDADPLSQADVIELTVPALTTYLSVVRTATAGLAARLSFTFDEIEDLRIAVDEACVMLLSLPGPQPPESATLTCRFRVQPDALAVTVSAPVGERAVMPADQSFAWQVLTAHAAEVSGSAADGYASVGLLKRRRQ